MRLWIIFLISLIFFYEFNEGACKGKCKRKKSGKDSTHGSDAQSQIDDIESKKQDKPKTEEESEEKDKKEKEKLGQELVQRFRRADSELKREPEQSEEARIYSQFAFRQHHKRQAPTHEHSHNKDGEPVGDIKDANVWTERKSVSRKRRELEHHTHETDDGEKALDGFAKLLFDYATSIETEKTKDSKYDENELESVKPFSSRIRHPSKYYAKNPLNIIRRKKRDHGEFKGHPGIRLYEESDVNRWNLERRRYPTSRIGPAGRERVLPLPVYHPEYPIRTNARVPPYKPKYPDPNSDF